MLLIVLVLVLAALASLITALIDNSPVWAWISIALSVLAALALLFDWWRARRAAPAEAEEAAEAAEAEGVEEAAESAPEDAGEVTAEAPALEAPEKAAEPAVEPSEKASETTEIAPAVGAIAAGPPAENAPMVEPADDDVTQEQPAVPETLPDGDAHDTDVDFDAEPDEEETDAADLLIVSELDADVLVVDEHPRYHLFECTWLAGRDTIPIAVAEARELGFTPCARCGPDASLADTARKRTKKAGRTARG